MDNPLSFHQVSLTFNGQPALQEISFSVPRGSFTAVLGPNGSGKSTLLRLAMNLVRPDVGQITLLGTPSTRLRAKQVQAIGYAADGMELPWGMTAHEFFRWCQPLYPTWDEQLERKLVYDFEVTKHQPISSLSRGQRMKVALVASLAYRPEILLLDGPFSGLDPLVREQCIAGILEMAEAEGSAVLLATHDIEEVQKLADRLVVLERGRVRLEETMDGLLGRYRQVEILLASEELASDGGPLSWRDRQQNGRVVRFIETDYQAASFSQNVARAYPGAVNHSLFAMPLREIFINLLEKPPLHLYNS